MQIKTETLVKDVTGGLVAPSKPPRLDVRRNPRTLARLGQSVNSMQLAIDVTAEFEGEVLRERIRAGLAHARIEETKSLPVKKWS